jgi:WD40 repeat protein
MEKSAGFSPDGRHFVYWLTDKHDQNENWLQVLDLDSGVTRSSEKVGFVGEYDAMVYAPVSGLLATVIEKSSIRFWDLRTLEPRGLIRGPGSAIRSLAFSLEGKTLANGGEYETRLCNVELRGELIKLDIGGCANWVAFLADGRTLIACYAHEVNGARVWQADPVER